MLVQWLGCVAWCQYDTCLYLQPVDCVAISGQEVSLLSLGCTRQSDVWMRGSSQPPASVFAMS